MGLVVGLLIVVSLSVTKVAQAGGAGLIFWGKVKSPPIPCTAGPYNPCNPWSLTAPYFVIASDGTPPFVGMIFGAAFPGCAPVVQKDMYMLGIGINQGSIFRATLYCAHK